MRNKKFLTVILSVFFLIGSLLPSSKTTSETAVAATTVQDNPPSKIDLTNIFTTPSGSNSTVINNNIVQVTPATGNQKGGIWSTVANKIDLTKNFNASMYLYFGDQGANAGDGMAFVMHNDLKGSNALSPNFGSGLGVYAGQNPGSSKTDGIQNSFAVEFDTYVNNNGSDGYFDTNVTTGNHVAWSYPGKDSTYIDYYVFPGNRRTMKHNNVDGNVGVQYPGNLSNDTWRKFTVNWNATSKVLTYQLQGLSPVLVPIDVQDVFGTNSVYWGFTGSTGSKYETNRVAFDQVPGLVNADLYRTITREDSSVVKNNDDVYGGEVLTYKLNAKYLSGLQEWANIYAKTTINNDVSYIPGSMTLTDSTGTQVLSDYLWAGQSLNVNIGNMNITRNDVTISFKVKVNKTASKTYVTENATFNGNNANYQFSPSNYYILPNQKPEVTINDIGPIHLLLGEDYQVNGTWFDSEKSQVLIYKNLNGIMVEDGTLVTGDKINPVNWSYFISHDQLEIGRNIFSMNVYNGNVFSNLASLEIYVESAPTISLEDAQNTIPVDLGNNYTISGNWNDIDSNTIDLYYLIDNSTPVKFASNVLNATNKGDNVNYSYDIPSDQLPIGTHQITVYGLDDSGRKSNTEQLSLDVTGKLTFTNVSTDVSFVGMEIPNHPTFTQRNNDWDIRVEDTRRTGSSWRVTATLETEFSDDHGHKLTDALKFVDENGIETNMSQGIPVNVFTHNTVSSQEIPLIWQNNQGILLKVNSFNYAGEYAGTIRWSLVDAP